MSRLPLLLLFLPVLGCDSGPTRTQAEIDRGRTAVTAALDSWKANLPPARLKSLPDPVEFSEELQRSYTLTAYELGPVTTNDPNVIHYTVTLTLKDRKGKVSTREVVYAVALGSPVKVGRDPFH